MGLKDILGIGIFVTLVTLMGVLIKGIVDSGFYNPYTFPAILSGTLENLSIWGSALGGVVPALIGVVFVFVTLRIVVTLL